MRRLDGAQQQPLRILRRDALIGQAHIDDRDLDVGLGLLRDRLVGERPGDQEEDQDREGQPRIADGEADDVHGAAPYCVLAGDFAGQALRRSPRRPRRH